MLYSHSVFLCFRSSMFSFSRLSWACVITYPDANPLYSLTGLQILGLLFTMEYNIILAVAYAQGCYACIPNDAWIPRRWQNYCFVGVISGSVWLAFVPFWTGGIGGRLGFYAAVGVYISYFLSRPCRSAKISPDKDGQIFRP
jgi:hypothetical protein